MLSSFEGAGLRVIKAPLDNANAYWLVAETSGRMTGKAVFEMPLADPVQGWKLPDGPSAVKQVMVRWNQGGWEFHSPAAAKTQALPGLKADESGALIGIISATDIFMAVEETGWQEEQT